MSQDFTVELMIGFAGCAIIFGFVLKYSINRWLDADAARAPRVRRVPARRTAAAILGRLDHVTRERDQWREVAGLLANSTYYLRSIEGSASYDGVKESLEAFEKLKEASK